ncbi:MAG TPA: hypothetical protein VFF10_04860 [Trueperaceae bacterium]|nr:hypothetical protein [Trueperaceae bacterium]
MARERWDRNFWLGVLNGVFVAGGDAFFNSSLVLAPFLAALGASPVIIGLIPAMRVALYFLPQLLVANRLSQESHKLPFYRITSTTRNLAFLAMSMVVLFGSGLDPGLIAAVVVGMVAINATAGGIGGVPFADVTAKVVPHSRLGTFWAARNVIGGLLALGSGLVLRAILDSDISFPRNFGYLFLFGTILASIGNASFSFIREPAGEPGMRRPLIGMLRYVPGLVRTDKVLRQFLSVRFLGLVALLAEPFYGIHALENLGAPEGALGLYVIVATAASIVANFAFRVPSNRGRNLLVLQIGLACLVASLSVALLVRDYRAFAIVFLLSAVGNAGIGTAAWNLLYAIAPANERALYIGLVNSVLALPSLAPVAAGAMIIFLDLPVLLGVGLACAVVAFTLALGMRSVHELDQAALKPKASAAVQEILEEAKSVATDAEDTGDYPTEWSAGAVAAQAVAAQLEEGPEAEDEAEQDPAIEEPPVADTDTDVIDEGPVDDEDET